MRAYPLSLIAAGMLALSLPAPAEGPAAGGPDAEAKAFASQLEAAAQAGDKEKLAALIAFPVESWAVEAAPGETRVESRADFLARYPALVTARMRKGIAQAKLSGSSTGSYLIWHDQSSEYSLEIERRDGQYRVTAYDVGAY
jgi:hypothetical protein